MTLTSPSVRTARRASLDPRAAVALSQIPRTNRDWGHGPQHSDADAQPCRSADTGAEYVGRNLLANRSTVHNRVEPAVIVVDAVETAFNFFLSEILCLAGALDV